MKIARRLEKLLRLVTRTPLTLMPQKEVQVEERQPDIEVQFFFNDIRKHAAKDGYRPMHLMGDHYLTTGVHHYYSVESVAPCGTARGTITFITPWAYPHSLWSGKRIQIQEGDRIVGYAIVVKLLNESLLGNPEATNS